MSHILEHCNDLTGNQSATMALVSKLVRQPASKLLRATTLRWYLRDKLTRMEVIQFSLNELAAKRYLEIGVADGTCFSSIVAPEKIGVDPISAQPATAAELEKPGASYFALTSDDFFNQVAPRVLSGGVDVVFIDGLHTFEQAYRDCLNSLKYLTPGGVILFHDCLPASEAEARVARTHEEAVRLNGPGASASWTGDVWKAIVTLRARHNDLQACVLRCDRGVGLVYKAPSDSGLSFTAAEIDAMNYSDLVRDADRLLGLRRPIYLRRVLRQLAKQRASLFRDPPHSSH